MDLNVAVNQYLAHCQHVKNLSHHTIKAYTIDFQKFQEFTGSEKKLEDIDRELLRNYVQYMFEEKILKETSVKRRVACLKSLFRWYEYEEVIEKTPFRAMDLKIKMPKHLPKALDRKEIRSLLKTPLQELGFTHRNSYKSKNFAQKITSRRGFIQLTSQLALELLFATGIRVGELVSIEINDVSAEDKKIKIKGKGDRERVVFLPDQQLINLISTYESARNHFQPQTQILLINTRGTALNTQVVRLHVRNAGETANLDRRITPHMLRHSAATHLLDSGVDIRHVQKLLGHQSITTTQIYTHVSDTQLKEVICKSHPMGELMG